MEEKKKEFVEWIKTNRKKLLFAGISATAIGGVIIGIKNREAIIEMWELLQETMEKPSLKVNLDMQEEKMTSAVIETLETTRKYTLSREPYDVRQHIRTLSEGMHHSQKKALEAAAMGIVLAPNETLVNQYSKGDAA